MQCVGEPGKPLGKPVEFASAPHDRCDRLAQPPTGIPLKSALQVEMQCKLSNLTGTNTRSTVLSAFLRTFGRLLLLLLVLSFALFAWGGKVNAQEQDSPKTDGAISGK